MFLFSPYFFYPPRDEDARSKTLFGKHGYTARATERSNTSIDPPRLTSFLRGCFFDRQFYEVKHVSKTRKPQRTTLTRTPERNKQTRRVAAWWLRDRVLAVALENRYYSKIHTQPVTTCFDCGKRSGFDETIIVRLRALHSLRKTIIDARMTGY